MQKLAVRFGAVAVPRERDVHKKPLPRWGGLAMVGAFLLTLAAAYGWIVTHRLVFPWTAHQLRQFTGVLLGAAWSPRLGRWTTNSRSRRSGSRWR